MPEAAFDEETETPASEDADENEETMTGEDKNE